MFKANARFYVQPTQIHQAYPTEQTESSLPDKPSRNCVSNLAFHPFFFFFSLSSAFSRNHHKNIHNQNIIAQFQKTHFLTLSVNRQIQTTHHTHCVRSPNSTVVAPKPPKTGRTRVLAPSRRRLLLLLPSGILDRARQSPSARVDRARARPNGSIAHDLRRPPLMAPKRTADRDPVPWPPHRRPLRMAPHRMAPSAMRLQ